VVAELFANGDPVIFPKGWNGMRLVFRICGMARVACPAFTPLFSTSSRAMKGPSSGTEALLDTGATDWSFSRDYSGGYSLCRGESIDCGTEAAP
jgi:hypothetical protein